MNQQYFVQNKVNRIRYYIDKDKIMIQGSNKMDYAWAFLIISMLSTFILLIIWSCISNLFILFLYMITVIVSTVLLKGLITFSISITKNLLIIKKMFCGIPYLKISKEFDNVIFNENISFLSFRSQSGSVYIENHEGFEVDCLLVTQRDKYFEFGDKQDAEVIFRYVTSALHQLKITVSHSDHAGFAG